MKPILKKIGIALLIVLAAIQFIRPEKNIAASPSEQHIRKVQPVPADVDAILKKACYDCHSNNTVYPWYNNIQPVAWWLNDHVQDGKKHLNFDAYTSYNLRRQFHKMEEIEEQVKEGEMPMTSYTLIHSDAKLTEAEKNTLINWSIAFRDTMKAQYPIDSLIKPKK
jgi:hypothetical protein